MNLIIMLAVVYGISFVMWRFMKKGQNKRKNEYLDKYPDAVKIYTEQKGLVVTSQILVHTVNNEVPTAFSDAKGTGFYCNPGLAVISLEHSSTRPGVVYKTVTKSTGAVDIEVDIVAGKEYVISFDKENNTFKINER